MRSIKYIILAIYAAVLLSACSPAEGNFPGSEYMPDMAHPISYEANTYAPYSLHHWDSASVISYRQAVGLRLPVRGTVPRGYAGLYFASQGGDVDNMMALLTGQSDLHAIAVPMNGHVPFYYENSEEERTRASNEIIANPFPITAEGLARGKALYDINCGICHGENADGQGYLVSESNPNVKYPAQPANMQTDTFLVSSNGRYYYAIMYGKNLMGAYADKLNYEERWQVIHYIRSLQAKAKNLKYDEAANNFNPAFGTPGKEMAKLVKARQQAVAPPTDSEETGDTEEEGSHSSDDATQGSGHSGGGR